MSLIFSMVLTYTLFLPFIQRNDLQVYDPEIIYGPNSTIDNPFNTLVDDDGLKVYVANSSTSVYSGTLLDSVNFNNGGIAIDGGYAFDVCGAWLHTTWRDTDAGIIRGWYHAERKCDYQNFTTNKSVGYAESYDDGLTFVKPNYPDNQVILAPEVYTDTAQDDEGDLRVIRVSDYFYMYFLASRDWSIHLARATVSSGGVPGSWYKYYNGAFTEPGLGGESSAIANYTDLASSWVSYNTHINKFVGFGKIWRVGEPKPDGWCLSYSDDGLNWEARPELILPSQDEWARNENSGELVAYPSILGLDGDNENIGSTFYIYYMYLYPGEGFNNRYLMRRMIIN